MRVLIGMMAAVVGFAQGTTTKPAAADYPVNGEAGSIPIGAEYMVHSFGSGEQMYVAQDYLVVEVALYFPKDVTHTLDLTEFALHINGKKTVLMPQSPAMAASSVSHPEWRQRPTLEAGGGVGGIGVGMGGPQNRPPFPGAPTPQPRYPAPPRAPDADSPGGIDRQKPATPEETLVRTALPTDPHRGPVSGFLYFPYTGKTSSIKSLVLTWQGGSLKLR